jgi:hypothetical protein
MLFNNDMTWKDVTVWQWIQLQNLLQKTEGLTELDVAVKSLAILSYQTENQIDSLSVKDLNKQLLKIKFITDTLPEPKPVDFIKTPGRKYRCIYDIRNIPYARYLETKFFGADVALNIHKIAASMVMPMKKTWRGWKVAKYDSAKHEEYAEDILEAPFEQVYGSIVFFCRVFNDSIRSLSDYFKTESMKAGMTEEQAETMVQDLCSALDGFTKLPLSQSTKE